MVQSGWRIKYNSFSDRIIQIYYLTILRPVYFIGLFYLTSYKCLSISNDPKKYLIHQENFFTYQLTLINVQLESSGLYKCQNFTAKEENRFQVNVMGKKRDCSI